MAFTLYYVIMHILLFYDCDDNDNDNDDNDDDNDNDNVNVNDIDNDNNDDDDDDDYHDNDDCNGCSDKVERLMVDLVTQVNIAPPTRKA